MKHGGNYIYRMSTRGTWCDNLIIQAVANALNCLIHIVSSEICSQSQSVIITPLSEDRSSNYITIGYLSGLHYVLTENPRDNFSPYQRRLRACLYGEKLSRVEGSPPYIHFLTKLGEPFT